MNPETLEEYRRLLNEQLDVKYTSRKANPQEGDVINDLYGTQVYLDGQWNVVDYNKPDEVQSLREKWADMAEQRRLTKQLNAHHERLQRSATKTHRGVDIGGVGVPSSGVHLHVSEEPEDEKVYTEVELDNATLESYTQGKRDFANELLQLLAAEEAELKSYGRTELYGIHKATSVIQQALNEIQ